MMIDVALAVLLALVLIGGAVMTRRLTAFKQSRDDLGKLVASLSLAVDKAHVAIADLKAASDGAETTLSKRLHDVRKLADEVAMMHEAGESLARRLEQAAIAPRRAAQDTLQTRRLVEGPEPTRGEKLTGLAAQIAALEAARTRAQRSAAR